MNKLIAHHPKMAAPWSVKWPRSDSGVWEAGKGGAGHAKNSRRRPRGRATWRRCPFDLPPNGLRDPLIWQVMGLVVEVSLSYITDYLAVFLEFRLFIV